MRIARDIIEPHLVIAGRGGVRGSTSAGGIRQGEMPPRGPQGLVNGFQLWVNLPAALKMSQPRYQEIAAAGLPVVEKDGARVRLGAGRIGRGRRPGAGA